MKFESIEQFNLLQWATSFFAIGVFVGLVEGVIKWSRMLLGAPDPMRIDILWTAAGFYGFLSALVGLGIGLFSILFFRRLKLPDKIGRWIPVLCLGLIVFWGSYNAITLIFTSSRWALAILALGISYQTVLFLANRKPGLVHFLSSKALISLGLVIVLAGGVNLYRYGASLWALTRLPSPSPGAPNVLLITLDTLRADHMSAYGYQRDTTPNLSQFASEGVLFDNAFSTASWTLPSHATIMTGLYTSGHQAESATGGRLKDKFYTLAEAFSTARLPNDGSCCQ